MPVSETSEPHAGRVALVTGAARGIGQAIAAGLAERATLIILGSIDGVSEASDLNGATGLPSPAHEHQAKGLAVSWLTQFRNRLARHWMIRSRS
jgi:NAD(P)-dependent dehydrogenase (short-subunit alcohol dehydrogenase family)